MSEPAKAPKPEFSRLFEVARVFREGGLDLALEASAQERAALARRLGLPSLRAFTARLRVEPWRDEGLELSGRLTADLSQICVVTLEPLEAHFEEPVLVHYLPAHALPAEAVEALADPDAPDPPEPLPATGGIDAGELVVQCLSVVLDPYPRKPGVVFALPGDAAAAIQALHPFAGLASLKSPKKG